jgi:competence CoiA-like predicted nuclease
MSIHHNIIYGIHDDTKNRIFVSDSRPCDKDKIKCEICSNILIAKKGNIKVHHYAHKSSDIINCDDWAPRFKSDGEHHWHLQWQYFFRDNNFGDIECVIKKELDNKLICHRSDIITQTNYIVEIQHSNISDKDVVKREEFYGDNLIWIINGRCGRCGRCDMFVFLFYTENDFYIGQYHKEFIYSFKKQIFIDTDYGLFEVIKILNDRYCIVKRVNSRLKTISKKLTKLFDKNIHNMIDVNNKLIDHMKNNDLRYNDYNDIKNKLYFCDKFYIEQNNILNVIDKYTTKLKDYLGHELFLKLFNQIINNDDEYDMFVRKILEQTNFSENFIKYKACNEISYKHINNITERVDHLRFNFHADDYSITLDNKKVIDLFNDFFGNYHVVIPTYKGGITTYIVSLNDYNKYDYWKHFDVCPRNVFPYHISIDYSGKGTVYIIKDILKDIYLHNYGNINEYHYLDLRYSDKELDINKYNKYID